MDAAARLHRVTLVGPLPASTSPQHRAKDGFGRENFVIDFDQREVTCPNGQVSGNWQDLPAAEPTSVTVRFDARQCGRCPEQTACTPGPFRSLYPDSPPARTPGQEPRRSTECRLAQALRTALRGRGHDRGVCARPSRTPVPLPRPGQNTRPALPDRTRDQHRTAEPPRTRRLHPPAPPTHGIPAVPRRTRPTPPPVVATRQMTPDLKISDRVAHRNGDGATTDTSTTSSVTRNSPEHARWSCCRNRENPRSPTESSSDQRGPSASSCSSPTESVRRSSPGSSL